MLLAMAIAAVLCVGAGCWTEPLYAILPYQPVTYAPYTASHVLSQLQLLMYSALAFTFLQLTKIYPPELRSTNLDTDWFYRKPIPAIIRWAYRTAGAARAAVAGAAQAALDGLCSAADEQCNERGAMSRNWSTSGMVIWAAVLLAAYLVLYYL